MKRPGVCLIILLMLVVTLGCVSYISPRFHIYEGDKRPLEELATIRLEFPFGGSLESVDGKEVYPVKVPQAFIYVMPGERNLVVSCYAYVGESKSTSEIIETTEKYSHEFKAGWLYRLRLNYDLEKDKCNYTYKFQPYSPEDQGKLRGKFR